jgi:membrane protein DedA with SNARE-associated domain
VSTSAQLPGALQSLAPLLDSFGYLALGGFVCLEDFGVPLPGETILVAAAVYAGTGRMNVVAVGIVALIAAIVGDNIGFAIGHFGGRALVLRFGRYVGLTESRLDKTERFFRRHGGKVVTVARFIEGLRQANGIVAGIAKMPWRRFLVFNAIGAALWVAVWTAIGYVAGAHIGTVYDQARRYILVIVAVIVLAVLAKVVQHLVRRRRRRADEGSGLRVRPPLDDRDVDDEAGRAAGRPPAGGQSQRVAD